MHKLKSMFKKDKDHHESTPSSSSSGAHPVSSSSNQQTSSYGGQQASSSSGQQAYGGQQVGGASSSSRQQDPSYGGQQASPVSRQQDPSYGGQQAASASRQQDPSYGGQQAASSNRQQAPTGSAFPPNNAPSTGVEKADNAEGVVMHTNVGDIIIALFSQECPRTCKNFATLAATGKYDNVIFHRIIPGFMIQGGDPTGTGRGGSSIYGEKFEDEFVSDLRHTGKGIMSMANSGPNTNGSQFFICLAATPHLDGKHTVFGQVADGMDVVDRLGAVKTGAQDRPVQEVKIMRCDVF